MPTKKTLWLNLSDAHLQGMQCAVPALEPGRSPLWLWWPTEHGEPPMAQEAELPG